MGYGEWHGLPLTIDVNSDVVGPFVVADIGYSGGGVQLNFPFCVEKSRGSDGVEYRPKGYLSFQINSLGRRRNAWWFERPGVQVGGNGLEVNELNFKLTPAQGRDRGLIHEVNLGIRFHRLSEN